MGTVGVEHTDGVGDPERKHVARRDLRVERLRRCDAHLDVAAVGRVEHAVGLVDEIAVATVDDRDDRRTAVAGEVDGAVGVGGGAALADRDDQRVAHVGPQPEARELGGRERLDEQAAADPGVERAGEALPGDGGRALADHGDAADGAVAQSGRMSSLSVSSGSTTDKRPSCSTILPRNVLRNDAGASEISLSRKCG